MRGGRIPAAPLCLERKFGMKVKDIMHSPAESCDPGTRICDVAGKMNRHDCGIIPIVMDRKVLGVVTDRDIAMRIVAAAREPREMCAMDAMSIRVVTVNENATIEDCCGLMGQHKLRRLPVVDQNDELVGVVSMADIAKNSDPHETGRLMKLISEPEEAVV